MGGASSNGSFCSLLSAFSKWPCPGGRGWCWGGARALSGPVRNPVTRKMKGKHRDMMTDYGAKRWLQGPPDKYSNSPPALCPGLLLKVWTQLSAQAMGCGLSFHLLDRYLGSLPASPKDHNSSFCSLFGVCSPQCSALQNLRGPAQAHLEKSARENGVRSQKGPPPLLSHGKVTKFPSQSHSNKCEACTGP